MFGLLAVGGPRLDAYGAQSLDLGLIGIAVAMLVITRIVLGVRMRWQVILGAILVAPLVSPLVRHMGLPQALVLTYLGLLGARSLQPRRTSRPT